MGHGGSGGFGASTFVRVRNSDFNGGLRPLRGLASCPDLIIERALAKDKEQRYSSASELADALRRLKGATPEGKVIAEFKPTGLRPKILDRMFSQGIPLPKEITALFPAPPGYKPSGR